MEITGKIIVIGQTEAVGSAGTFKKRQLVVATEEQYSQQVAIDFVQDKTSLLDNYSLGESVVVGINIRGNEYQGRYFVSLNGWKINKQNASQQSSAPMPAAPAFAPATNLNEDETDDLPF